MRNKFLGTGETGYHPLRKIKIIQAGLRFAILNEFSVAYKMALSTIILVLALVFQQLVDFELILPAAAAVGISIVIWITVVVFDLVHLVSVMSQRLSR